jgi:hypothetical protein
MGKMGMKFFYDNLARSSIKSVEHSTHTLKVTGLSRAISTNGENGKQKSFFDDLLAVAQWYNTCLIIPRSKVQALPLTLW